VCRIVARGECGPFYLSIDALNNRNKRGNSMRQISNVSERLSIVGANASFLLKLLVRVCWVAVRW